MTTQFVTKVTKEDGEIVLLLTKELLDNLNLKENQFLIWDVSNIESGRVEIQLKFEEKTNEAR